MAIRNRIFDFLRTVTTAGVQFASTAKLLGRTSSGGGDGQEIALGNALAFSGNTLEFASVTTTLTDDDLLHPEMMGGLVRLAGFVLTADAAGGDELGVGFVVAQGPGTIRGGNGDLDVPDSWMALVTSTGPSSSYQLIGNPTVLLSERDAPDVPTTIAISGSLTTNGSTVVTPGTLLICGSTTESRSYSSDGNASPPVSGAWFVLAAIEGMGSSLFYYLNGSPVAIWAGNAGSTQDPSEYSYIAESPATGTATVVNGDILPAFAIGQTYRVGQSPPYRWFRAAEVNPTVWEEF